MPAPGSDGEINERTAFAWQRTAVALMAAAVVLARVSSHGVGTIILLPLGLAVALTAWVFVETQDRYDHEVGLRPRPLRRGGLAPAGVAVATALLGVTELTALVLR